MLHQPTDMHERYHALDALRASMMLLGLIFHTLVSYTVAPDQAYRWAYYDAATTPVADVVVSFLHIFRMPVFFVLAGFFAAMLYARRGPEGLAWNRFMRIAVPFVIGWLVLHPLVVGGVVFANVAKARSVAAGLFAVEARFLNGTLFFRGGTLHLWFLYYLIYFYALALLLAASAQRLPAAWHRTLLELFESMISMPLPRLLILAAITAGALLPVDGILPTPNAFVPDPRTLFAYGVFFGFGWVLFLTRGVLPDFHRFAWTQTLAGIAIFLIAYNAARPIVGGDQGNEAIRAVLRSLMGGVVVWLLFFGLTGLFLRYLDRPSAAVRYIVDSSYWIYLVHLPFMFWIPGLLSGLAWSPWAKISIVLSVTSLIAVLTYDLFVRPSAIGAALNGRRYPSGLLSKNRTEPKPENA